MERECLLDTVFFHHRSERDLIGHLTGLHLVSIDDHDASPKGLIRHHFGRNH